MKNPRVIKEIPRNRLRGVDGKRCASLEAGQIFNQVEIKVGKRKVHNLLIFSAKLWTL